MCQKVVSMIKPVGYVKVTGLWPLGDLGASEKFFSAEGPDVSPLSLDYNPVPKESMPAVTLLDKAVYWVNIAYIASVCLTLATTFMVVFLSHQRSSEREAAVKRVELDSQQRILDSQQRVLESEQRVAAANERAATSNSHAAEWETETASANLAREKLRKENLQLSTELEHQKRLRMEVEERMAHQPPPAPLPAQVSVPQAPLVPPVPQGPRVLTPEQEQAILDALNNFGGTRVSIIELGDAEAGPLAQQIARLLQNARWNVVVSRFGGLVPPQHGVVCTHGPDNAAASAFVNSLKKLNMIVYDRGGTPDQFEIIIGLRPPA